MKIIAKPKLKFDGLYVTLGDYVCFVADKDDNNIIIMVDTEIPEEVFILSEDVNNDYAFERYLKQYLDNSKIKYTLKEDKKHYFRLYSIPYKYFDFN